MSPVIPLQGCNHIVTTMLQPCDNLGYRLCRDIFSVQYNDCNVCIFRESTGSMSEYGSESESGLVSRTALDPSDIQAVTQLDFALPRYILMLDVWYSQV